MENIFGQPVSIDQWFQLFVLAMGILVFSSFVSMISIWFINAKLSDINEKLIILLSKDKKSED